MTGSSLDAAEKRAHETCWPARLGEHSGCPSCAAHHAAIRNLRREAFNAGLERAAVVAETIKGGFTVNIRVSKDEQEMLRDPYGPWVLNSDVATAIRALAEPADGD